MLMKKLHQAFNESSLSTTQAIDRDYDNLTQASIDYSSLLVLKIWGLFFDLKIIPS
jgi:hypothetical protein